MKILKIFLISISGLILLIFVVFFGLVQRGEGDKFELNSPMKDFICRPGLKAVSAATESNDGGCGWPMCYCYVCTKCGDTKCGIGENRCNCPEDCK